MKIAVISDLHGNMHALDAVLDELVKSRPDRILCAGDIVNPFYRSLEVWRRLDQLGIPVLRGNHEDYICSYFSGDRPEIRESIHFRPVQLVARHLGEVVARELAALPFDLTLAAPDSELDSEALYLCHASPEHNARSYIGGVTPGMAQAFGGIAARTVVAGHIHQQWQGNWGDKHLLISGSVGLPHHGKPEAEYLLIERRGGAWVPEFRTVAYDQAAAMVEFRDSGALERGGPTAWLLYDELWCAKPRLAHFLPRVFRLPPEQRPRTLPEWAAAAQRFLEEIGRWDALRPYCTIPAV